MPPSARRLLLAHHARWLLALRTADQPGLRCTPAALARTRLALLQTPAPLDRPVLVLGGYSDPGLYARLVARELRRLTSRHRADFLLPRFSATSDIRASADAVAAQVRTALQHRGLPADAPVDAVGISMGGLVARAAAGTLPIARLFTLGTPHRGAALADRLAPTAAARQMRPGSDLLAQLDHHPLPAETRCYFTTNDAVIGPDAGVAPGAHAHPLAPRPGEGHFHAMADPLALLDIARRLRREDPVLDPA